MKNDWIKVTDELPLNSKLVQIAYKNKFVTVGRYTHKFKEEANFDVEEDWDYNEKEDKYYSPEGWKSECLESEYYYPISDVTHWSPLLTHPLKQ